MNDHIQLEAIRQSIAGKSIFLTGAAGTGKSYTLRTIIRILKHQYPGDGEVAVCASTGIAALPLEGVTVHSWGGLEPSAIHWPFQQIVQNIRAKQKQRRWKVAKVLIIDEISLLSPQFWELIENLARILRNSTEIFGGLQVILCGDFLQLPPVQEEGESEYRFCFETPSWQSLFHGEEKIGQVICLQKVHRSLHDTWTQALDEIRRGELTMETRISLMERVIKTENNSHVRLYSRRKQVDQWNQSEMSKIAGDEHIWIASDTGLQGEIDQLDRSCLAARELKLKIGAPVLLLKNMDLKNGLVNGRQGIVTGFTNRVAEDVHRDPSNPFLHIVPTHAVVPVVRFGTHEQVIDVVDWSWGVGFKKSATRKQIPLMLAHSITVHKSQGMTLDEAIIDLRGVFEDGQAYVALSRVRSLEGLLLYQGLPMKSLRTDKKALQYWDLVCHPPIIRDFPKNLPVYLRVGALIRWDDLDDSFGKLYESDSEWFVLKPIDNHIKLYNDQYGLFEREATTEEMLLLERENVKENGKSKQIDLRVFFRNTVSQKK